jgi:hypothetical protein
VYRGKRCLHSSLLTDSTYSLDSAAAFYVNNFNFTPSDVFTLGANGPEVGAFLHLDRGKEWVDHRAFSTKAQGPVENIFNALNSPLSADTLFLQTSPDPSSIKPTIHHAAFEVFDVDQEVRHSRSFFRISRVYW